MNELFLAIFTVWVMVFVVFAMIGIPAAVSYTHLTLPTTPYV